MPVQLEIPIFTADVEEFDVRSFERTGCRELVDLCREMNPAKDQRIRLELNAVDSYPNGGLTPNMRNTVRFLTHLRKSERLREDQQPIIRIMIRPRGFKHDDKSAFQTEEIQDFQYSRTELLAMCHWIQGFKACGRGLLSPERGDGFVFGVQRRLDMRLNGLVLDAEANRKLIKWVHPYPCFLHRAFDGLLSTRQNPDIYDPPENEIPKSSVEDLVAEVKGLGFKGVLTSGGWGNATDNLETLSELGRAVLKERKKTGLS